MKYITILILIGLNLNCTIIKSDASNELKKSILLQAIEMIRYDSLIYKLNNLNIPEKKPLKILLSDSMVAPSAMLSLSLIVKSARLNKQASQKDSIINLLTKDINIENQYKIDRSRYRDNRIQFDKVLNNYPDDATPDVIIFIEEFSNNYMCGEVFGVQNNLVMGFDELAFYNNSLYFIIFFDENKIIVYKSGIKIYN